MEGAGPAATTRTTTAELLSNIDDLLPDGPAGAFARTRTDELLQFAVGGDIAQLAEDNGPGSSKVLNRNTSDDIFQNFLTAGAVPSFPQNGASTAFGQALAANYKRNLSSRMTTELKNLLEESQGFERTPSDLIFNQILDAGGAGGVDLALLQQQAGALVANNQGVMLNQPTGGSFVGPGAAMVGATQGPSAAPAAAPAPTQTLRGISQENMLKSDTTKEQTQRNVAGVLKRLGAMSPVSSQVTWGTGPAEQASTSAAGAGVGAGAGAGQAMGGVGGGQRTQQQVEEMLAKLRNIIPLTKKGPMTRSRSNELQEQLMPFASKQAKTLKRGGSPAAALMAGRANKQRRHSTGSAAAEAAAAAAAAAAGESSEAKRLQAVAGAACMASGLSGPSVDRTATALADMMAGGDARIMTGLPELQVDGLGGEGGPLSNSSMGSPSDTPGSTGIKAHARRDRYQKRQHKRGGAAGAGGGSGAEDGAAARSPALDPSGNISPAELLRQVQAMDADQLRKRVLELEKGSRTLNMRLSFANRLNSEQTLRISQLEALVLQLSGGTPT